MSEVLELENLAAEDVEPDEEGGSWFFCSNYSYALCG